MKRAIKGVFLMLLLFFLVLFLNKNNNYYENETILTEAAIEEFERDLKEGKKINPSHYIQPKKDYNNQVCKIGIKCSMMIEKAVNTLLKKILDSIEVS